MIRQPDFITTEVLDKAFEITRKKKPHPLLDEVAFETIEDGLSVQTFGLMMCFLSQVTNFSSE